MVEHRDIFPELKCVANHWQHVPIEKLERKIVDVITAKYDDDTELKLMVTGLLNRTIVAEHTAEIIEKMETISKQLEKQSQ